MSVCLFGYLSIFVRSELTQTEYSHGIIKLRLIMIRFSFSCPGHKIHSHKCPFQESIKCIKIQVVTSVKA